MKIRVKSSSGRTPRSELSVTGLTGAAGTTASESRTCCSSSSSIDSPTLCATSASLSARRRPSLPGTGDGVLGLRSRVGGNSGLSAAVRLVIRSETTCWACAAFAASSSARSAAFTVSVAWRAVRKRKGQRQPHDKESEMVLR